ncbi:MAG TPA: tyrosine-type recombinase/integrase [Clostridia bacterium]|nr:tyrosine-type recombinase/integrase [Clostridia bacterium]
MTNNFAKYLSDYLSIYLPGVIKVSNHTINSYRDTFKLLLKFAQSKNLKIEKITLEKITKNFILEFLEWIEKERNCSISTRNQRLAAIKSFFKYVQAESPENLYEIRRILNIRKKKCAKPLVAYLTSDELKIIFNAPDLSKKSGRRDLTLLVLLYDSGARVNEIINVAIKDVRLNSPGVITLYGKGNKIRQVPLMKKTCKLIEKYIEEYKKTNLVVKREMPLFFNQKKKPLSRWGVNYIINKYVVKLKEEGKLHIDFKITPHVFRHSKAMHLLQANINLIYIRDFLGHTNISTTEIYARADIETKRKALENVYQDLVPGDIPMWDEDADLMDWLNKLGRS